MRAPLPLPGPNYVASEPDNLFRCASGQPDVPRQDLCISSRSIKTQSTIQGVLGQRQFTDCNTVEVNGKSRLEAKLLNASRGPDLLLLLDDAGTSLSAGRPKKYRNF